MSTVCVCVLLLCYRDFGDVQATAKVAAFNLVRPSVYSSSSSSSRHEGMGFFVWERGAAANTWRSGISSPEGLASNWEALP